MRKRLTHTTLAGFNLLDTGALPLPPRTGAFGLGRGTAPRAAAGPELRRPLAGAVPQAAGPDDAPMLPPGREPEPFPSLPSAVRNPLIGVDAGARIGFLNAAAGELLQARDGLVQQDGRLGACSAAATMLLRESVRRVAQIALAGHQAAPARPAPGLGEGPSPAVPVLSGAARERAALPPVPEGPNVLPLALPRPCGGEIAVLVVPAMALSAADSAEAGGIQVLALVQAVDPRLDRRGPPPALLCAWLGFTRAEAEVALRAARGEGLRAIAETLGITHSTARSHLQRVFQKTGVRRQAELAWLIAHLPG